ncbi:MAG: glycosyltransferase family 4 protein [Hyphomicrobiaceae bacterium]|nr:glycosyltransferase family 4 protein [Hyphomicrobiaceae bacterium]
MTNPKAVPLRVLFITQFFDPEPAFKGLAFAQKFMESGHSVEVITGFPNYPNGKVYPGYKIRFSQTDVIDGIKIHRVPLYPSHDKSALGRVLNYVSFAVSATIRGVMLAGRADVIYVYHPPLTAAMSGAAVGFIRRLPVVTEVQDLWPDTLRATGMIRAQRVLNAVGWVCKVVYRYTTRIIVQSPGFRDRLVQRGVPLTKLDLIINWADEARVDAHDLDLRPYSLSGRFNVLFTGTMGIAQGLDVVLDAARIVGARNDRVQFVLVGGGVDAARLRQRVADEGLVNVRILPGVARSQIGMLQDLADVLLVALRPDPLFEITIPSKTQTYMSRGKPIIISASGDAARLVEQAEAGVAVAPGDVVALADAVLSFACLPREALDAMGRRGQVFYAAHLSFDEGFRRTIDSIRAAIRTFSGERPSN